MEISEKKLIEFGESCAYHIFEGKTVEDIAKEFIEAQSYKSINVHEPTRRALDKNKEVKEFYCFCLEKQNEPKCSVQCNSCTNLSGA